MSVVAVAPLLAKEGLGEVSSTESTTPLNPPFIKGGSCIGRTDRSMTVAVLIALRTRSMTVAVLIAAVRTRSTAAASIFDRSRPRYQ